MSDSDSDQDFPSMFGQSYHNESLRPPPESGEEENDSWDWREALIDNATYRIDKRNHTSAQCPVVKKAGRDGARGKQDRLQVTFCLAPPPRISYFCMSYCSGEPTQFSYEPRILATEGNLAIVGLMHAFTLHSEPSNYLNYVYRAPVLALMSRLVSDGFRKDVVLNSSDIVNNALEPSLFVAHPKLSSHDDDILYLMTKASLDDRVARVIAVDMRKKKVRRMAKFTIQREACTDFAYVRTTISNYLSPDSQEKTKRRGPPLQESSHKKPRHDLPPMDDDDEGDYMDLE